MAPARIAIAGFTSKLARLISLNLLEKPGVEVVGICRDTAKLPKDIAENPRIQLWKAESTDSTSIRKALFGASTCICCYHLGYDSLMVEGQKILIDACISERVPRYVASDFSFDFRGLKMGDFPFKDFQYKISDYLRKKESEGGIKAVHVLNGGFFETVLSPFMGILDVESKKIQYWGSGDEKWEITSMEDIAKFTAEVAVHQDATGVLKVLGDRKSIKEIGSVLENQYGVQFTYKKLGSLEDLHKTMVSAREDKPQDPYSWLGLHYHYFTSNGSTLLGSSDNSLYPNFQPADLATLCTKYTLDKIPTLYN